MDRTLGIVLFVVTGQLAIVALSVVALYAAVSPLEELAGLVTLVANGALLSTHTWPQLRARLGKDRDPS